MENKDVDDCKWHSQDYCVLFDVECHGVNTCGVKE